VVVTTWEITMKYLAFAIIALASYSAGTYVEQARAIETLQGVSEFALSFGYICGAFRDPKCLDDFRK
jgi:hypothetical protein